MRSVSYTHLDVYKRQEWEACEADRLKALDEVSALADEGKPRQAENLVQRAFNEFRGKCRCV